MPGLLSWVVMVIRGSKYKASDVVPGPGSNIRHPLSVFPSLHRVPRDQFPGFISNMRVLRLPAAHPAVLHAWRYLGGTRCFRSPTDECAVGAWSWSPGISSRDIAEETTGSPKFLGNPNCPFAHVPIRRRQDCSHQTIQCSSVAPGHRKAKAPTKGLSTLNSMAFGLAVYASQCGLLQPHARLASSCWSGSTGRAFHPQGSDERFQSCRLHLILLSQALLGAIDAAYRSCAGAELP